MGGLTLSFILLIIGLIGLMFVGSKKLGFDFETALRLCLLAVCVIGFIHYGSTKGVYGRVTVANADAEVNYLTDNGSYVTNDHVHVNLTKSPLLPDSAWFYCHYRDIASTNDDDWVTLFTNTIGNISFPTNIVFQDAWSNDWVVGTSYTRQQAKTNRVAEVIWIRVPDTSNSVPFRTGIYTNGVKRL